MEQEELRLGRSVRRLRAERALSLKQLAERASVSESFISQVERGVANPSVASLRRIAEALGTSIGALFDGRKLKGVVVRADDRAQLMHPRRKWQDFLLTPQAAKRLQVILSVIEPGAGSGKKPYAHDSDEECVIVLQGRLEFRIEDESYVLEEGDSLTFESRLPHWNRNPGDTKTEVLWIITPPSY
ncbi:MAG: helix-turn-helix domain-containing protein [Actinomycetota bacterium]